MPSETAERMKALERENCELRQANEMRRVPDANTLWDFREALIAAGVLDTLFARLDRAITEAGYLPMSGQIVDATLVAAPRQRLTDGEKAAIKKGRSAGEIWPEKPAKARQKDTEARWTKKHGKSHYGYKNHVGIDRKYKFIRRYQVTEAAVHSLP